MIIFLILLSLFLSKAHYASPAEEKQHHVKNAHLFNEFMKTILDKNGGGTSSNHGTTENETFTLSNADAAKLLELVEKNLAEKVRNASNKAAMQIDELFKKIMTDIKEFNANENMEPVHHALRHELKETEDKVQILMLLLSFASRLAFTIGSKNLKTADANYVFPIGSFVLAYNKLEQAFPAVHYENYIFRYYHGAKMRVDAYATVPSVSFDFKDANMIKHNEGEHGKYNSKALHYYAAHKKVPIGKIVQEIAYISNSATFLNHEPYEINAQGKLTNYLVIIWKWMRFGNDMHHSVPYDPVKGEEIDDPIILFALKNFAANLIKLMLHKKETISSEAEKFFKKYVKLESELKEILAKLDSYLNENREKVTKMDLEDLINQKMLLHFEDAFQLDWRSKEEFSIMAQKLEDDLFIPWKTALENCKFENGGIFIDCQIDIDTIQKQVEESDVAIQSLLNDGSTQFDYFMLMLGKFDLNLKGMQQLQAEIDLLKEEEAKIVKSAAADQSHKVAGKAPNNSTRNQVVGKILGEKNKKFKELFNEWKYLKEKMVSDISFWTKELQKNNVGVLNEFNF